MHVHWPERFEQLQRQRAALLAVLALGVGWLARLCRRTPFSAATLGYTVACLTAAALLLLVYRARWVPRARWVSAPIAFLGRYSYGIYIWHVFAAEIAHGFVRLDADTPRPVSRNWCGTTSAIGVGVLATAVVEQPVLRAARPVDAGGGAVVRGLSFEPEPPPRFEGLALPPPS